jgi:hypothetical protein
MRGDGSPGQFSEHVGAGALRARQPRCAERRALSNRAASMSAQGRYETKHAPYRVCNRE